MEFEYGKIEAIEESTKHYITLTISQKVAYKTKLRKFNVWNVNYLKKQMAGALQKGTNVKFIGIKNGDFYKLRMIEESEFSECFGCGACTPLRNKQQMECEKCYGSLKQSKLDDELKLVKRKITEYKYSSGITLSFIDEKEECLINHLYVSTSFESSTIYSKLCQLKVGDKKHIRGWITEENDLNSLFEIIDVDDIQGSS